MRYYATCPVCGYRLFKSDEGTQVEIQCPKCKEEVIFTVTKNRITIDRPHKENASSTKTDQ